MSEQARQKVTLGLSAFNALLLVFMLVMLARVEAAEMNVIAMIIDTQEEIANAIHAFREEQSDD